VLQDIAHCRAGWHLEIGISSVARRYSVDTGQLQVGSPSAPGGARGPARDVVVDAAGQRRGRERAVEHGAIRRGDDHRLGQGLRLAARDDQQARDAGGIEFGNDAVVPEIAVFQPAGIGLGVDLLQRGDRLRMGAQASGRAGCGRAGRQGKPKSRNKQ